jgi:hypothetical protein
VLVASTPDCEVEVPGGLVSLKSQGRGHVPHPVVGGAVRHLVGPYLDGGMLYQSSPAAWWCYIVRAGWHRDGVYLGMGDCYPLSPSRGLGACMPLSRLLYLVELDLSPLLPRD